MVALLRRPAAVLALVGVLAAGTACGSDPTPPPRVADHITLLSGDGQAGPAGSLLPSPLVFQVRDAQGPLAGVHVTFGAPQGSGFASATEDTSDAQGQVSVQWTIGGTLGDQTLSATVSGVAPAVAHATATVGPLALLTPVSNPSQFVVVGRMVSSPPVVAATDAFGNPIAGQAIDFNDSTGRSTIVGGSGVTNAQGRFGVTSWRIANVPGSHTLVARTGGGPTANFVAFGIPAAVQSAGGDAQVVNAGTQVPVAPSIRALDDLGQPLGGVVTVFAVSSGGGRLLGTGQVRTGADGIATAPGWILGTTPGPNLLTAGVSGTPGVAFQATGIVAVPAAVSAITPAVQNGFVGNFGASRPTVRVTDAAGNPVAGVSVNFAAQGSGTLSGTTPKTEFDGTAFLGSWRFGAGPQVVTAAVGALTPLSFSAATTPVPPSTYRVEVRFVGPDPTTSQKAAFDSAAARWSRTVVADLADTPFSEDLSFCGGQVLNETIDDLVIFAKIDKIDGPGNILGQAGPCYLRDDNLLSLVGFMEFDVDDVAALEASGRFGTVVLHEMGHVLGVGSLWSLKDLLTGAGTGDPYFTGPSARMAFAAAAAPGSYSGNSVPVENTGGGGTRDVHWRESVLVNELMTGFLNNGTNPLSAITAASLRDEGYIVDDSGADPYSFFAALRAAAAAPLELRMMRPTVPIRTVDRRGRPVRAFDPGAGPFRR